MNPEQAKAIIEKLIEEHGPDCGEAGHFIGILNGKPIFAHKNSREAAGATMVCKVGKSGMKRGFTGGLWNEMGDLLSKAVNEAEKRNPGA